MARNAVNEIIAGKLYQRGKILTLQQDKKVELLEGYGIDTIVNFWPKLDANLEAYWVFHMATDASKNMMNNDIDIVAETVAMLIQDGRTVLVLCEAGKTRSVYFTILVVSYILGLDLEDALAYVEERVPNHRLKDFMVDYIKSEYCEI